MPFVHDRVGVEMGGDQSFATGTKCGDMQWVGWGENNELQ